MIKGVIVIGVNAFVYIVNAIIISLKYYTITISIIIVLIVLIG